MARANRHYIPGYVWHITHRCHQKEFLLKRCLVYIDLNMVRAGVVDHPQLWPFCGYNEIQNPPRRYRIIDRDSLARLLGISDPNDFQSAHRRWVAASLSKGKFERKSDWTQSIAVGGKAFVEKIKETLGFRAKGRAITGEKDHYQLRENIAGFGNPSVHESDPGALSCVEMNDTLFWNDAS